MITTGPNNKSICPGELLLCCGDIALAIPVGEAIRVGCFASHKLQSSARETYAQALRV